MLTGKQKRHLRALGHKLKALIQIGKKEIEEAEDHELKEAELVRSYREQFATPYQAASRDMITDVIEPAETRARLAQALRISLTKRVSRPAKKHGLIPL